jgi:hypothetical protein
MVSFEITIQSESVHIAKNFTKVDEERLMAYPDSVRYTANSSYKIITEIT